MLNALSIDVEEWFHAELLKGNGEGEKVNAGPNKTQSAQSQVVPATERLLELLEKHGVSATFFMLGEVAEKHPALVNRIAREGHELASHGFSHTPLYELDEATFGQELEKTEKLLRKYSGQKVKGFRAPTFSLNQQTRWALAVLEKRGYAYDSSIFPASTGMYGVPSAPLKPYHPSLENVAAEDRKTRLLEIPPSVLKFPGARLPVAGGFFLRAYPYGILEYALSRVQHSGRPIVLYAHPWEFYEKTPRPEGIGAQANFISFHGQGSALSKLDRLLEKFEFGTMAQVWKENR